GPTTLTPISRPAARRPASRSPTWQSQHAAAPRPAPGVADPLESRSSPSSRGATPAVAAAGFIGLHDALHEGMAHDVVCVEERERHSLHTAQHIDDMTETRLLAGWKVRLRDVARHDGLRAEADARQEHLHLLDGRVLRLIENNEGIVERAATH